MRTSSVHCRQPHRQQWPLIPWVPQYMVTQIVDASCTEDKDIETVEARLVFADWLGREVSIFARRSHPRTPTHGAAVLHLVGGAQTIHPGDLAAWTQEGYAAASFDWQLAGVYNRPPERSSQFPSAVVPQFAPTSSLEAAMLPVAVQAAAVCLDWLAEAPGVDPQRLGVVGISWGGYLAWLLAAYDDRVRAIVPAFGCGGLFLERRNAAAHAPEVLAFWKQHWEPSVLGFRITAPVCYLSSTNDFFGDPLVAEALLATLKVPHIRHYLPNVDHSLCPGQTRLAKAWMAQHLLDGPSWAADLQLSACEPGAVWWTDDFDVPSIYRCWRPGPAPSDRPVLAFATKEIPSPCAEFSPLKVSTPLQQTRFPSSKIADTQACECPAAAGTAAAAEFVVFGLGWKWELGSTRHFNNEASAKAPLTASASWQVIPARQGGADEAISIILHLPRDQARDIGQRPLSLGWSEAPVKGEATITLHALVADQTHVGSVIWNAKEAAFTLEPSLFPSLPGDFAWDQVGRIQVTSRQMRRQFQVGPLKVNCQDISG